MADELEITPIGLVRATVRPPGSKSITNRALVCAALAEGPSTLVGALQSEDTQVMADALRQLGIGIEHDAATHTLTVHGRGGALTTPPADIYVANSGTTIRFLPRSSAC